MNLRNELQQEYGCTYVVVAHDLGTTRYMSDRRAVMYLGITVHGINRDLTHVTLALVIDTTFRVHLRIQARLRKLVQPIMHRFQCQIEAVKSRARLKRSSILGKKI